LTLIAATPTLQRADFLEKHFVKIVMNGEPREIASGTTVARLLDSLKMQPRFLAVERNFELVPRTRHAECVLEDGDKLEIVTLVGGG
jgi:thiamine biosynthesis protein ThiS